MEIWVFKLLKVYKCHNDAVMNVRLTSYFKKRQTDRFYHFNLVYVKINSNELAFL